MGDELRFLFQIKAEKKTERRKERERDREREREGGRDNEVNRLGKRRSQWT